MENIGYFTCTCPVYCSIIIKYIRKITSSLTE